MATDYSVETCRTLAEDFRRAEVLRPFRRQRYDPGDELTYDVRGVFPAQPARAVLRVEKFVGGGFAGQVYRVRAVNIDAPRGDIPGLSVGGTYAVKILIPPAAGKTAFRNAIYRLGFQGPFPLQSNPAAARAGALWQKFIRRAAALRFGDERAVVDILATFVDPVLGSCGEISEWVDGRTWRFEVDDRLDLLRQWRRGEPVPGEGLGSPEYRAKKQFMADFVKLLHEMGAAELARQYEWSTCKSQPNCLKRNDTEIDPAGGLTAVDFRAGLALLPVLPMSPGDFKLIGRGVMRGSLVQFDRGDLGQLERFLDGHVAAFADMRPALEELKQCEKTYRDSQPDITHNHVRLLYDGGLYRQMLASAVTGWRVQNIIDDRTEASFRSLPCLAVLFAAAYRFLPLAGLAAAVALLFWKAPAGWGRVVLAGVLVVVAFLTARLVRRLWGRQDYRRHFARMLTSWGYFLRAMRARRAEMLIRWHRAGRVNAARAESLSHRPIRFLLYLPLSVLPAFLHRLLTDRDYAAEKLAYVFVRPIRLLVNPAAREQWLREMLEEGRRNHMLTDEDAERIGSQVSDPFIQKYLKCLAVHVCTLPVTQLVSVSIGAYMALRHGKSWQEAWAIALGIIALFQVIPVSPGSLVRGLYVLYLVIRERDFRNYNIAVFLSFFKYIGYLAFPIQMAYHHPALARFMAGHWATGAVHVIPVFGEHGALLEHAVFNLFYNHPLTLRRRIRARAERRAALPGRRWHVLPCVLAAAALLAGLDLAWRAAGWNLPRLREVWWLAAWPALLAGAATAAWAGNLPTMRRIFLATVTGVIVGLAYSLSHEIMPIWLVPGAAPETLAERAWDVFAMFLRRGFYLGLMATVGGILAEITFFGDKAAATSTADSR